LPLNGISSIERCLSQCFAIKGLNSKVILATSYLTEDSILKKYTLSKKIIFSQGDPDDVIKRYLDVCQKYKIDVVVRVTGDCPLIMPEINEYLLDSHFNCGADFTYAENATIGTAGEIINTSALKKIYKYFNTADYSEYMSWYFKNNSRWIECRHE
jgi:spore coat polysaccharide biosynthesis protein SpsF (cytidylyltransferase family)